MYGMTKDIVEQEEIKRLREEIEIDNKLLADRDRIYEVCQCPQHGKCTPYVIEQLKSIADKDINLAKWQQIAIEERAKLHFVNLPSKEMVFDLQPDDIQNLYRSRAAKELGLQVTQEAGYLERLEAAYLQLVKGNVSDHFPGEDPELCAHAALEKIRKGR